MSVTGPRLERVNALPERILTEPRRGFGAVLAAIVVAVIFQLSAPETDLTRLLGVLIHSCVILLAVRAAGAQRRVVVAVALLAALFLIAAVFAVLIPGEGEATAPGILTLVLILMTPMAVIAGVVRELREDGTVTVQTVICGLCLYLLLGLAFASLYSAIESAGDQPFFNEGIPGSPDDFLYFSLATLTTTGYGDFSAATELGRAMSVTEALIGQIYLVTVLAVIVSNVGQRRRSPT